MPPNGQCVPTVFRAHTFHHSFLHSRTHQQAIDHYFNEKRTLKSSSFVMHGKIREHAGISVLLGAKRVHALFSAFQPYIKIQMRTLSMNMHKLVVRYEANSTTMLLLLPHHRVDVAATAIASYCDATGKPHFSNQNNTNNVWEKYAWTLLPLKCKHTFAKNHPNTLSRRRLFIQIVCGWLDE